MTVVREWTPVAFIIAIFIGDIYAGITIPLALLLIPILLTISYRFLSVRLLSILLAAMSVPVFVRLGIGGMPNKIDLTVYLPVVYAALALAAAPALTPDRLRSGIFFGAGGTAAIMIAFAIFVPVDNHMIPGQNLQKTDIEYAKQQGLRLRIGDQVVTNPSASSPPVDAAEALPETPAASGVSEPNEARQFGTKVYGGEAELYDWKNRFKNLLGLSNYVAAFLVFGMTVALFTSRYALAIALGVCIVLTMSRFGIMFGFAATLFWAGHRLGMPRWLILSWFAGSVVSVIVAIVTFPELMPTSILIRGEYWQAAALAISKSLLLGWNRSDLLTTMGWTPTWHPHNVLLWVAVYTGIVGLGLYLAYFGAALWLLNRAARLSPMFEGVFVAVVVSLAWSMFEPIAMTPAFEILLATALVSACTALSAAKHSPQAIENLALAAGEFQPR